MREIKDGDHYKTVTVHGKSFELKYGFYEEFEKNSKYSEPIPIYPDFRREPIYTDDGYPFVTGMQEICERAECALTDDNCCAFCKYYEHADELIGICRCDSNKWKKSSD